MKDYVNYKKESNIVVESNLQNLNGLSIKKEMECSGVPNIALQCLSE